MTSGIIQTQQNLQYQEKLVAVYSGSMDAAPWVSKNTFASPTGFKCATSIIDPRSVVTNAGTKLKFTAPKSRTYRLQASLYFDNGGRSGNGTQAGEPRVFYNRIITAMNALSAKKNGSVALTPLTVGASVANQYGFFGIQAVPVDPSYAPTIVFLQPTFWTNALLDITIQLNPGEYVEFSSGTEALVTGIDAHSIPADGSWRLQELTYFTVSEITKRTR